MRGFFFFFSKRDVHGEGKALKHSIAMAQISPRILSSTIKPLNLTSVDPKSFLNPIEKLSPNCCVQLQQEKKTCIIFLVLQITHCDHAMSGTENVLMSAGVGSSFMVNVA